MLLRFECVLRKSTCWDSVPCVGARGVWQSPREWINSGTWLYYKSALWPPGPHPSSDAFCHVWRSKMPMPVPGSWASSRQHHKLGNPLCSASRRVCVTQLQQQEQTQPQVRPRLQLLLTSTGRLVPARQPVVGSGVFPHSHCPSPPLCPVPGWLHCQAQGQPQRQWLRVWVWSQRLGSSVT